MNTKIVCVDCGCPVEEHICPDMTAMEFIEEAMNLMSTQLEDKTARDNMVNYLVIDFKDWIRRANDLIKKQ
jgi:hypothetical protein